MLNKYWLMGFFGFFLLFFGVIIFWSSGDSSNSSDEKEIVWIEKPSFMLLKDIKSVNPVLRREAIIKLGEKRVKNAIKPLFEIMFSDYPLYEKQLSAKSVAMISGEEIIPHVLKILAQYKEDANKETILSMLSILKNLDLAGKDLSGYDFSLIDFFLMNSKNNEIVLHTIETIENLKYKKSFYNLSAIYSKSLFYKISVLKAMTGIAMDDAELSKWYSRYLNKILWEESHDDIKKIIREAFFSIHFKRKPGKKESTLIGLMSDLSSNSYKKVFEAEVSLLDTDTTDSDELVFKFFLKDQDPLIANRLVPILVRKNLKNLKEDLFELIKNRYSNDKNIRDIVMDTARKAVLGLSYIINKTEDINTITGFFNDYHLGTESMANIHMLYSFGIEKDFIEKKLAAYNPSRTQLFSYIELMFLSNNAARAEKLIGAGDFYTRYNGLNLFLKLSQGKLSEGLKWLAKNKDRIVLSVLKRYQITL